LASGVVPDDLALWHVLFMVALILVLGMEEHDR
jgi:hypothetical protein